MATVEERLAFVEGRVQEHSLMFAGLREAIVSLEQRIERRFDHVDARFTVLEERLSGIDRRIDALEQKVDQKIGTLERKIDRQLEAFRQEISTNQRWLVGLQMTTILFVIGAAFAR